MTETNLAIENGSSIPLTQSGYERLQAELENLTAVKRPEIAGRIRESQQHGEFSEDNSELDEVKFEQAIVENRITELKSLFSNAIVLEESMISTDAVGFGSLVSLTDLQWNDTFEIRVVASIEAEPNSGLISSESPIGNAVLGREKGEEFTFSTPEGKKKYRINSISC